jgi:hypothetical protein
VGEGGRDLVQDEEEEVKAREERVWEVHILGDALAFVVPPVERIGSSQHRGTSVERGGDARLGDGDGLLLHHLVDGGPVRFVHLSSEEMSRRVRQGGGGGTLSNSSMQQIPRSARTRAPPSRAMSPVSCGVRMIRTRGGEGRGRAEEGNRIANHSSGEADPRAALAGGVHPARGRGGDVLEQL